MTTFGTAGSPDPSELDEAPRGRGSCLILLAILLVGAGTYGAVFVNAVLSADRSQDLETFAPTPANRDPSLVLPGVTTEAVTGLHVEPNERVAYTSTPPTGGSHDQRWAACTGVVYDLPIRSETVVHSMEHGAIWIAFDPERLTAREYERLAERVRDVPYMLMSPYPGLPVPISLQSWGHRLGVSEASDTRIDQFVTALRQNPYTHPELGARCEPPEPRDSGIADPPPFLPPPSVAEVGRNGVQPADVPATPPQPDIVTSRGAR